MDSLLRQTYKDVEVVVVDDASTDATAGLLRRYVEADSRVTVITNPERLGLAGSLNRALRQSRGELVARMDADDESDPVRLEKQVAFLSDNNDVSVLGTGATLVDCHGRKIGTAVKATSHEELVRHIWYINPFIHPTVMARKKFFSDAGGYNPTLYGGEDADLWLRTYGKYRFHNLSQPLLTYTVSAKTKWRDVRWGAVVQTRALIREGWSYVGAAGTCRYLAVAMLGAAGVRRPRLR